MSANKRRVKFSVKPLPAELFRELKSYLGENLGVDYREFISGELWLTCLGKNCIIYNSMGRRFYGLTLLYSDGWIGVWRKGAVAPSPRIYEEAYNRYGLRAALIPKPAGLKAFLYGNDILEISIDREIPPLNGPVAVVDPADNRVVGAAVKSRDRKGRVYYRNIYDLGMFVREWG